MGGVSVERWSGGNGDKELGEGVGVGGRGTEGEVLGA